MLSALLFQLLWKFENFKDKRVGGGCSSCTRDHSLTRRPDSHFLVLEVAFRGQSQDHPADQGRAELPPSVPVSFPGFHPRRQARMSQGDGVGGWVST